MADLIVVAFDDEYKAESVRVDLLKMKRKHLIDLEEATVAVRKSGGAVRLHHSQHYTLPGGLTGGFVGTLVGLMFFNPILAAFGMLVGASAGASMGALKDVGIKDAFMREVADRLQPGTSVLFIVARQALPEKIVDELGRFDGHILQTSLSHDDEGRLRQALDAVSVPLDHDSTPDP